MIVHTSGIVIRNTKYGENSIISQIFTRLLGMQTFIVNSVHAPKAQIKASLIQPFTVLDMVIYHSTMKSIHRIKEARPKFPLTRIHFDVRLSTIAIYCAELITKAVRNEEPDEPLFDFIESFIHLADSTERISNLPLFFTMKLTQFLGFSPENNTAEIQNRFDMQEGKFQSGSGRNFMPGEESELLSTLLKCNTDDFLNLKVSKSLRNQLLQHFLLYYALHIPAFGNFKSFEVLSELFDN